MSKQEKDELIYVTRLGTMILKLGGSVITTQAYPDGTFSAVLQGLREGRGPISKIIDEHLAGEQAEERPRRKVS